MAITGHPNRDKSLFQGLQKQPCLRYFGAVFGMEKQR